MKRGGIPTDTPLDVGRLAQAVSRPGIDPRTWVSLAIINEVVFVEGDGLFCSITLMPSQTQEMARVGTIYAGNGWGLYAPLHENDEVLVEAPSGDPNEGLVITQRLHSPSDPLPDEAQANAGDFILVIEPGQSYRLKTTEAGSVIVDADGQALITANTLAQLEAIAIKLGKNATNPLLLSNIYRPAENTFLAAIVTACDTIFTGLGAAGAALSTAGADPTFSSLAPVAAAAVVTAGAALTTAAAGAIPLGVAQGVWTGAAASFLSTKVKTE